ncbi:MAG: hypothetical protein AAFY82_00125 [Pseudomonadota bacterium]
MALNQAEVDLYNLAMDSIGQSPIESSEEDQPGTEVAERRYRSSIGYLLGLRTWSFDREIIQLSQLSTAPTTGFDYAYQLTTGKRPRAVYEDLECKRPYRDFRILNNELHADAEVLYGEFASDGDPARWPDTFKKLAEVYLAAQSCMQHTGSRTLRRDLMSECFGPDESARPWGGLCGTALAVDSQYEESFELSVAPGPLMEARQ